MKDAGKTRALGASGTLQKRRHGVTFAEVTVATAIVGMLIVAALRTLGGATQASRYTAEHAIGLLLAGDLMSEIMNAEYAEPTETAVFGIEPSESSTVRAAYDDVDDYNGWDASPPQLKDGTVMSDKAGWRRTVSVRYLEDQNLGAETATDRGVKEITVTVNAGARQITELTAIRTDHD